MLTEASKNLFAFCTKLPQGDEKQGSKEARALTQFHPVLCHLSDVGAVSPALWREMLPRRAQRQLAQSFAIPEAATEVWFANLIALHDLSFVHEHIAAIEESRL